MHVERKRFGNVALHLEALARMLAALDVDRAWNLATEAERRKLIDAFLEGPLVPPDYVDVNGSESESGARSLSGGWTRGRVGGIRVGAPGQANPDWRYRPCNNWPEETRESPVS